MPRIVIIFLFSFPNFVFGLDFNYRDSKNYSSDDFLMKENSGLRDRLFENYVIVDAELDLGVSSGGCGQIDINKTLRASLKGVLDEKYFDQIGSNLASSSFMLMTCYWSPQICSILKSARINASMLGKLRFDQCGAINKYIDARSEDWELSRQRCFNKALNSNGGDADAAMESCGKNSLNYDLENWAGGSGGQVKVNMLIDSSAKWMGLKGTESARIIDIAKAFVGETVVSRGKVNVDFGSRKKALTPRAYYQELRNEFQAKLSKLSKKILSADDSSEIGQIIAENEIKELGGEDGKTLVSYRTLESLHQLPHFKRRMAMEKLASKIALHRLASDTSKAMDLLSIAEKNPNLPKNRQEEIREKRRSLKENVETTVFLENQKNDPVNRTLKNISRDGLSYQGQSIEKNLETLSNQKNKQQLDDSYFDCADGFMCLK